MEKSNKILIIDDKADVRLSVNFLFSKLNIEVIEADSPVQGLDIIKSHPVDLVLLDMNYSYDTTSGAEGLYCLKEIKKINESLPVIVITAWSKVELVVDALKEGASDFIEKPWDNQRLIHIIRQTLKLGKLTKQNKKLKQQINKIQDIPQIIAHSCAMQKFKSQLDEVAKSQASILLTGENGTGKSSLAHYIHHLSPRAHNPLISVNMGAIPENLFESEMFGHTKGAFTNAHQDRLGRFELASGSSLFLDEVANIPMSQQAKLLRVLESNEYERVGASKTEYTDVRLISATNANIQDAIIEKSFRQDLYFRLNTIELKVPSLRERKEDIPYLAKNLFTSICAHHGMTERALHSSALDKLQQYHFPGNLRELKHILERALLLNRHEELRADQIEINDNDLSHSPPDTFPMMTIEQAERQLIHKSLKSTKGHVEEAAIMLGISKSAIYRRLDKYGVVAKNYVDRS